MKVNLKAVFALACAADVAALHAAPMLVRRPGAALRPAGVTMQLWAGKKRSRYEDDGSRLKGTSIVDDEALAKGWFSNFKFGTEVEVGPQTKDKKGKAMKGMAADNSDRGLGGNNAYRNTETARMGSYKGQQIRKAKLEAYINSEEEASDGTFGKIISGSALLSIFGGLVGIYFYYGGDGLLQATAKRARWPHMSAHLRATAGRRRAEPSWARDSAPRGRRRQREVQVNRQAGDVTCMTTDCMTTD